VIKGDLAPPYEVKHMFGVVDGLVHAFGYVLGGNAWDSCCRIQLVGITCSDVQAPTCVHCALCQGCHACRKGHIRHETMRLGKWETKDGRRLYPFEMDPIHLMNAIAKLRRDKHHFKDNYLDWIDILETEARLRRLTP